MGSLRVARSMWRRLRRPFGVLQVEPTTHCFLHCRFCPQESLRTSWTSQHMSMDVFGRLSRSFHLASSIWLQGWGEPLLHPGVFEMVRRARSAGCCVGFTTNGKLLDEEASVRLVELGLDSLAVSIAGATPETHASLRVGSELDLIIANLATLARVKERRGASRPRVVLCYLMMRSNLAELPSAVDLASRAGVQEVEASNLSYVPGEWQDRARVFSLEEADGSGEATIERARRRAGETGIAFRSHPLDVAREVAVCDAVPIHNAFIAVDGNVFPCPHLGPPTNAIPRLFRGELCELPRHSLGNLLEKSFPEIWCGKEYQAFRRAFWDRRASGAGRVGWGAQDEKGMAHRDATRNSAPSDNPGRHPLPTACSSCYMARGV